MSFLDGLSKSLYTPLPPVISLLAHHSSSFCLGRTFLPLCFPARYFRPSFHHCFKSCSLSFLNESSLPLQPELLAMEKAVPCKAKVSYLLYLPRRWEDILHCKHRVHHRKGKKMTLYGPHCLSNTKLRASHILTHLTYLTVP